MLSPASLHVITWMQNPLRLTVRWVRDEIWVIPAVMWSQGHQRESREMVHFITCCDMQRRARTVTRTGWTDSGDIVSCPPSTPLCRPLNGHHVIGETQSQQHAGRNGIIVCSNCKSHTWNMKMERYVVHVSLKRLRLFTYWPLPPLTKIKWEYFLVQN